MRLRARICRMAAIEHAAGFQTLEMRSLQMLEATHLIRNIGLWGTFLTWNLISERFRSKVVSSDRMFHGHVNEVASHPSITTQSPGGEGRFLRHRSENGRETFTDETNQPTALHAQADRRLH